MNPRPFDCSNSVYTYRGLMLDVARHALSLEAIYKFVDLLSELGFNTLHLHLTDDQGWRWEVKKYPLLHEIGSKRSGSQKIPHEPESLDGKEYGHFYSQEELKSLVKYAAEKDLNIIPEVDLPGHSVAAIAAYPWLGGLTEGPQVRAEWGVFEPILNPTDQVLDFYKDVLDELIDIFPSKMIHLGGDEAPKGGWKNSSEVQLRILELGLNDEEEMQSWFMNSLGKHLNSRGRSMIGWDEILDGKPSDDSVIMCWRGLEKAREALERGYAVVVTPTSHTYFDYYQSIFKDKEPIAIGGYLPWEKVLSFSSELAALRLEFGEKVLGAQAQLWTEYLNSPSKVEYAALPRLFAFCEALSNSHRAEATVRSLILQIQESEFSAAWNMRSVDSSPYGEFIVIGDWKVGDCPPVGENFILKVPHQFINQMVKLRVQYTAGAHYVGWKSFEYNAATGEVINQMVNGVTGAKDKDNEVTIHNAPETIQVLIEGIGGSDNTGLFLMGLVQSIE